MTEEELQYRTMLKNLVMSQAYLESLDEIKDFQTSLYKGTLRKRTNTLSNQLEKNLKRSFTTIFNRDEQSFQKVIDDVHVIADWVAKESFENTQAFADAIRNKELKFEKE